MVEIELVGKPNHWSYKQGQIRIGRDSICDVSLSADEYPMVSREHVVLEITADMVRMSDSRSANGSFLNGTRTSAAIVRSGDTLRLGPDGPELRIRITQERAQASDAGDTGTIVAGSAPARTVPAATVARAASGPAPAATVVRTNPTPESAATVVRTNPEPASSATVVRPQAPQGAETVLRTEPQIATRSGGVHVGLGTAPAPQPISRVISSEPPRATHDSLGDEQMIERKLNSIRNLLGANLVVLFVLLLGLLYENQQINRNRDTLFEMRQQAQTAVGQFTPALDARLNAFETRLGSFEKRADGLDGKIKEAEDRFVGRMDKEMPIIMDKYVNRKMEEIKRQTPPLPQ